MKRVLRLAAFGLAATFALGAAGVEAAAAGNDKRLERARRALREGEFETAEKMYRELVERDAKDLPARLGLSYAQLKQRNLRDAYDNAARVVAVDPLSPRAHALLGSALLAGGEFIQSIEEFRTAITLDERDALAIAGISMINFYENRPGAALAGLRRAVEIDPEEPDFLFNFAQAAARSERYREAADAYEQFLRIAPRTDADRRARIRGLIDFLRYLGAQPNPLYEARGPARAELPFELVNSRPVVEVRLNNQKKPFRFVLDTGSGMCVIAADAAARLGLRPVARGGMARAVGGGGRFEIVYGYLNSIQLGEARVENVPVYIRDFRHTNENVDGYVGLSVLIKYLASVDYGANTLTLVRDPASASAAAAAVGPEATVSPASSGAAAAAQRVFELPIRATSSGFWSSAVELEGLRRPLNFIVDTGASISVVSQQLAEREDLSSFEQKARLKIFGAAGVSENVPLLVVPRVRIGPYTHPHLAAAVLDMAPINETSGFEQSGILGGNVLRFFRVTFDFTRGVVRLEMLPGYQPPVPVPREGTITPQGY